MTPRRIALIMAGAFAVYAFFVAWRGWDLIGSGEPVAVGLGLAVLILPVVAGILVWREVRFGLRVQQMGEQIEFEDERTLEQRIEDATANPDDWVTWYWVGVGYMEAGDKKQARLALDHAWDVR